MGDDDNQEERGVLVIFTFIHMQMIMITKIVESPVGGGRYCRNFWGGCAAGTPEPLTYTRASSAKFCYPILELTLQIPPILE